MNTRTLALALPETQGEEQGRELDAAVCPSRGGRPCSVPDGEMPPVALLSESRTISRETSAGHPYSCTFSAFTPELACLATHSALRLLLLHDRSLSLAVDADRRLALALRVCDGKTS